MNPIARAVHAMESAFSEMESKLPPPQKVKWNSRFVFRYIEKTPEQALLLKLARNISGIRAIIILFEHGYFQEQAVIQRTLDEILEDMIFLSFGIEFGFTDIHNKFLEAFWSEEIDKDNVRNLISKRSPSRVKIREQIEQVYQKHQPKNAENITDIRLVYSVYSGYVHAASPQIMDMYGGYPPHFHLHGMSDTPRAAEHAYDLWNYIYRGLMSCIVAAKKFGDLDLVNSIYSEILAFQKSTGRES